VAQLRDQLDSIKQVMQLNAAASSSQPLPEPQQFQEELVSAGLDASLAAQIAEEAAGAWRALPPGQQSGGFPQMAEECIRKRLQFKPEFAPAGTDTKRIVIFIGPPGAGKTSSLAKIAIRECLGKRLPVRIISVDTQRAAAHEKLGGLARIMGIGFSPTDSIREFIQAVDEFRDKGILLIDTPGFSGKDFDDAKDLIAVLETLGPKEIHLVLPASMNRDDLLRHARLYAAFQPDYLLFTKLDETESRGGLLSAALETNKPLSFLTAGQSIPEEIQPASPEAVLPTFLRLEKAVAISAA
jgi:flagellar biosynthesis protein FlhF